MTRATTLSVRLLGLGLLGLTGGCQPELEPLHWDAVDVEALYDSMANPTGVVDEASTNEVAALVIVREPAFRLLSDYFEDVFTAADGADSRPPMVQPWALDGTSVYVMVACPGALVTAYANPFADGHMRIDSPTLTDEVLASEEIEGQLLLTFEHCRIDGYEFNGSAVAFRNLDPSDFGFVPEVSYDAVDVDDEPFVMTEPVLWLSFDEGSALFTLESSETLVLEWSLLSNDLALRGTNGELVCEIFATELQCVAP